MKTTLGPLTLHPPLTVYLTESITPAVCLTDVRAIMLLGPNDRSPHKITLHGDTQRPHRQCVECHLFGPGSIKWQHYGGVQWSAWNVAYSPLRRVLNDFRSAGVLDFYAWITPA